MLPSHGMPKKPDVGTCLFVEGTAAWRVWLLLTWIFWMTKALQCPLQPHLHTDTYRSEENNWRLTALDVQ